MTTTEGILPNWLTRCAENVPERLALHCGEVRWSFSELEHQVTRLARQLAALGVKEQSRVALLAANGLEYVVCVHAMTRLGAILIPLNTRLTVEEHRWQVRDVQAAYLLYDAGHSERAATIAEGIADIRSAQLVRDGECAGVTLEGYASAEVELRSLIDLAATQLIMYTSGTTGTPKGVIITYGMQWWNAIGSALNLGHHLDDSWLLCLPLFHIGGLSILMRSVINGISVVLHERFDAQAVNHAIQEERITIISVVAVMVQRMLAALDEDEHYPPTLRCVLLGGGPAPQPLLEDCARRTIPVVQTYGLTESCSQAVTLAPTDALRKLGSAGRPLLQVQLRIMQEDGPAAAREPGVICLRGPSITPGYDHRPDATAQAIQDGWLTTGDIGYLDDEGYLYVLDRRSDLIISGGENVYPAEIEAALLSHPDVVEAGVCGRADEQWGQVPVAFVHLRPDSTIDADSLLAYLEPRLARYKQPHALYIVGPLPRNSAGKLLRRELPALIATS